MACSLLAYVVASAAFAQVVAGESTLSHESVLRVADQLSVLIEDAVTGNGGDLETQHVHWVFAFSTGHFAVEPLRAQAARETAIEILRRFAVPGDKVSAYAFEMDVWQHPGFTSNPITLPPDGDEAIELVSRIFPLTTIAGSVGGHDTELSLAQIITQVGNAHDVVLVALTNRAASVTTDATLRPLAGENSTEYQAFTAQMWRAPAANRSGASFEGAYEIARANGTTVENTLDIVVAVGRRFTGAPLESPRSQARVGFVSTSSIDPSPTSAATSPAPEPSPSGTPRGLLWVLGLLVVGGVIFYLFRSGKLGGSPSDSNVTIDGTVFSLPLSKEGLVCRVVTKNYRAESDEAESDRTLHFRGVPVGEAIVGRLIAKRGRLYWHDADFKATAFDGSSVKAPVLIARSGEVSLTGEVQERPGLPPRAVNATIRIERGTSA